MFPWTTSLPSIPCVSPASDAADIGSVVRGVTSPGHDGKGESLLTFSAQHKIIQHGPQLNWRHFWLMRFDGDRLQLRDEAFVSLNTALGAWLGRCECRSFKDAAFLRMSDPTADMPFFRSFDIHWKTHPWKQCYPCFPFLYLLLIPFDYP